MDGLTELKSKFWAWKTDKGCVKNFSGPLPRPRGHQLKEQFIAPQFFGPRSKN